MRRLYATLLSLALLGCGDATGILVEVRSTDLAVPADVDALRFTAVSGSGRMVDETFAIDAAWPHSLTLVPGAADDADVTITVTGLKDGAFVVRRVVPTSFQRGATRRVDVVLTRACVGVRCPEGVDCVAGACVDRPPTDGGLDAGPGRDAGAPDDAGRDAGGLDAGLEDAGPEDGGLEDAGPGDAGPGDAGPGDAGSGDAGPPDAGTPDAGGGPVRCAVADCTGLIVISELRTRGPAGSLDEFVEVHNRSSTSVDLEGVELRYRSTSGSEFGRATVATSAVVPPGGFLLFAGRDFSGTPDVPDRWGTGFSDAGGTVLLAVGAGDPIDLVGWGSATGDNVETAPIAGDCETSCERKARATSTAATMSAGGADADAGNGYDSDDNAADFVRRAEADPQNALSPVEMP